MLGERLALSLSARDEIAFLSEPIDLAKMLQKREAEA